MDFDSLVAFLKATFPTAGAGIGLGLTILGSLVVIGTAIDKMLPDAGKTAEKIMAIPFLGAFLTWVSKFSPFNFRA